MKKTLLALMVAGVATSASAGFEIYNQDGVTVNLAGDIEVAYVRGTTDGEDFEQEIQDADFGFDVRYAVTNGVEFGGYWEFDGTTGSGAAETGDVYVGLYSADYGSVVAGRTCTALDNAGIGSDYQFGIASFIDNSDIYCGEEIVRYDLSKGDFYTAIGYRRLDDLDSTGDSEDNFFDAMVGYTFAGLELTGFIGYVDQDSGSELDYAIEARYGIGKLNLEAGYYGVSFEDRPNEEDRDPGSYAIAADYAVTDSITVAAGYSFIDFDGKIVETGEEADDQSNWFVNAGWGFAPNTTAYVEVGGVDSDDIDDQVGFGIGVKSYF